MTDRWPPAKTFWFAVIAGMAGWAVVAGVILIVRAFASPVILPPAKYDHPFEGREIVEFLPRAESTKECLRRHAIGEACAWSFPDQLNAGGMACHQIYPLAEDAGKEREADMLRHERAHCSGWPADHPGGFYAGGL